MTSPDRPSWTASLSAGLGLLSLAAVLCFHFPELLTSRELRAVYTERFARTLLLAGLVAAFVLGTLANVRGRQRRNYAIQTPWIDRLFGTSALPDAPRWPDDYGLRSLREVPAGFWAQLASPFVRTPRAGER